MLERSVEALRRFLGLSEDAGQPAPPDREENGGSPGRRPEGVVSPGEEAGRQAAETGVGRDGEGRALAPRARGLEPPSEDVAVRRVGSDQPPARSSEGEGPGPRTPRFGHLVSDYLTARAEEMVALLAEEVAEGITRELVRTLEEGSRAVSAEVAGVREQLESSRRELTRVGREMVRSGAATESLQKTVADVGPAMERLEASLRADLAREQEREQRLRQEAERASLEDMLAAMDGLAAGLEHGRELVAGLAEAERRLKDATVQRWWRAMGEATGQKRPLPEVPAAELEGWIAGVELTHRRLEDALARRGITPIEAVGLPFDPHVHEAVAVEPCPPEQEGLVLRELRRGYRTPERTLRLAQVVVGKAPPPKAPARRRRPPQGSQARPEETAAGEQEHQEDRPWPIG